MTSAMHIETVTDRATNILILDDDPDLLFNLGAYLDLHGYKAICASNIDAALDAIRGSHVDIALVDYFIAGESGIDAMRNLRASLPSCPMVLMSAYLDDWLRALVSQADKTRCLRKPFAGRKLLGIIEELILTQSA